MGRRGNRVPRPSGLVGANGQPVGPVPFEGLPVREQVRVLAIALNESQAQQRRTTALVLEAAEALAKAGLVEPGSNLDKVYVAMVERRAKEAELAADVDGS